MPKIVTQDDIIERFRITHGNKYDYSKVEYKGYGVKVCIICPIHGEFWQTPANHIKGRGCMQCSLSKRWDTRGRRNLESWIALFVEKHGDKYDYRLIHDIKRGADKIEIICKDCGTHFFQTPAHHLRGDGCAICNGGIRYTAEQFVEKSKLKFGNKFKYHNDYKNNHTKIVLDCVIHGGFSITPQHHLASPYGGCPQCALDGRADKKRLPSSNIVKRLKKIHGDSIVLKEDTYKDILTPCTFICQKHGEFTQNADKMLHGCKCPYCTEPLGEKKIREYLASNGYKYKSQYKIDVGRLFGRSKLKIDFMVWIGEKKIAIEFNGLQHYEKIDYFHRTEQDFVEQQIRDEDVRKWCKMNKIKLIEIRYDQMGRIDSILKRRLK